MNQKRTREINIRALKSKWVTPGQLNRKKCSESHLFCKEVKRGKKPSQEPRPPFGSPPFQGHVNPFYPSSFHCLVVLSVIIKVNLPGAMTTTAQKRPISLSVKRRLFIRSAKSNIESIKNLALLAECKASRFRTKPFRQIIELV